MKLHSKNNTYSVVAKTTGASGKKRLLVKNEKGTLFLLLAVDDPNAIRSLAPVLFSFGENEAFSDFIESFSCGGELCAVFAYHGSNRSLSLYTALSGLDTGVKVRATRSLIGNLMAQDMPYPIICDVLRPENLLYTPDGKVIFVYDLNLSADYGRDSKTKAMIMLAEVARSIFENTSTPGLERFICALESLSFETVEEIYAAFSEIADELAATPAAIVRKPTLKERLTAASARLKGKIVPPAAVLTLIAGFLVLCYLFFYTVISPPASDNGITAIGTVEIQK